MGKYFSSYSVVIFRNGDRLRIGAEGIHKKDKSRVFNQDFLRPLGMAAESEEMSLH